MPGNAVLVLRAIRASGGSAGSRQIRLRVNRELVLLGMDQLSVHGVGQVLVSLATQGAVTKTEGVWALTEKGRGML